ncbi:S-adenosylmethionine mitochondrial carrier protein [Blattella germanica]|nr:S-adenosylmethionine mitochondrial carrier protein [Blattella germanica]
MALFPLDTLKTRLQSQHGFLASGGFGNLYKGVGTAAVGSIPTASLFFCTYNSIKNVLSDKIDPVYFPIMHMGAASAGEIGSCLLKVPIEVVKQRQQASKAKLSPLVMKRVFCFRLFSGFVPRTLWITLGGAVFFGAYQFAVELCLKFDSLK